MDHHRLAVAGGQVDERLVARADLGTEHIQTDERRALRAQVFACPDKINIVPAFVQRAFEHGKLGLHAPVQQRHHAFGLQRKVHVNVLHTADHAGVVHHIGDAGVPEMNGFMAVKLAAVKQFIIVEIVRVRHGPVCDDLVVGFRQREIAVVPITAVLVWHPALYSAGEGMDTPSLPWRKQRAARVARHQFLEVHAQRVIHSIFVRRYAQSRRNALLDARVCKVSDGHTVCFFMVECTQHSFLGGQCPVVDLNHFLSPFSRMILCTVISDRFPVFL